MISPDDIDAVYEMYLWANYAQADMHKALIALGMTMHYAGLGNVELGGVRDMIVSLEGMRESMGRAIESMRDDLDGSSQ